MPLGSRMGNGSSWRAGRVVRAGLCSQQFRGVKDVEKGPLRASIPVAAVHEMAGGAVTVPRGAEEAVPVRLDDCEAGEVAVQFDDQPPEALLAWAMERFGRRLAICSSLQAESLVVLDMAWRIDPGVRVFTVDTGRLPQETYDLIDQVRARYGITFEVVLPAAAAVGRLTHPPRGQCVLPQRPVAPAVLRGTEGGAPAP